MQSNKNKWGKEKNKKVDLKKKKNASRKTSFSQPSAKTDSVAT